MKIARHILLLAVCLFFTSGINRQALKPIDVVRQMQTIPAEQIADLHHLYEQLRYYGWLNAPGDQVWLDDVDPLFNTSLARLGSEDNIVFTYIFQCLEQARRSGHAAKALSEGDLATLLTPELKKMYTFQNKKAATGLNKSDTLSGIYVNVLYAFDVLRPGMEDLISAEITQRRLLDHCIKVRKEENLIMILLPVIQKYKMSQVIQILEPNEKVLSDMEEKIQKYEDYKYFKFPAAVRSLKDSLKYVQAFYKHSELLIESRNELLAYLKNLPFNLENYCKNYKDILQLPDTLANVFSEVLDYHNYIGGRTGASLGDYVDIIPEGAINFCIRLKFKPGTLQRIRKEAINLTEAEAFLIYRVKGRKSFKPQIDKTKSFPKCISGTVVAMDAEIPLGLTIKDINISQTKGEKDQHIRLVAADTSLLVKIELPNIGIWSRFKYDQAKQLEADAVLQISEALGVHLSDISIDPQTWDVKIEFNWEPQSFFNIIERHTQGFNKVAVTVKDLNATREQEFRKALQIAVTEQISKKVAECIAGGGNYLNDYFGCSKIIVENIKPVYKGAAEIEGRLKLHGLQLPGLDTLMAEQHLTFRYSMVNGTSGMLVSQPDLSHLIPIIRRNLFNVLQTEIANLTTDFNAKQISSICNNLANMAICTGLSYNFSAKRVCIRFKEDEQYCFGSTAELQSILLAEARKNLLEYRESLKKLAKEYLATLPGISCNEVFSNRQIILFGLNFRIDTISVCTVSRVIFEASFGEVKLRGEKIDGTFRITPLNKDLLLKAVNDYLVSYIPSSEYLYLSDIRYVQEQIVASVNIDLPMIELSGVVGEVKIDARQGAKLSLSQISNAVSARLNKLIDKEEIRIKFDEGAGIVLKSPAINLEKKTLSFNGISTFYSGIIITSTITVNLVNGQIDIKHDNPLLAIQKALAGGIFYSLMTVNGNGITALEINLRENRIKGVARIKLFESIALPDLGFTITKDKIDIDLRTRITLPVVVPILPPLVSLIDPTLDLKLDKKIVHFEGDFSMGVDETVRGIAKLVKVNSGMDIFYGEKLGDIKHTGDLVLAMFLKMYRSEGKISIKEKRSTMGQSTEGLLNSVIRFKSETVFDGKADPVSFGMQGNLNVLGLDPEMKIVGTADPDKGKLAIDGKGKVSILGSPFQLSMGTAISPKQLCFTNEDTYAEASGKLNIGRFELTGVSIKADMRFAHIKFNVMGTSLAGKFPTINAISEKELLAIIMRVLGSLKDAPEAILQALKDPLHVKVELGAPFGKAGKDGEGKDDKISQKSQKGDERYKKGSEEKGARNGGKGKGDKNSNDRSNRKDKDQVAKEEGNSKESRGSVNSVLYSLEDSPTGYRLEEFKEGNGLHVKSEGLFWSQNIPAKDFFKENACNRALIKDGYCLIYRDDFQTSSIVGFTKSDSLLKIKQFKKILILNNSDFGLDLAYSKEGGRSSYVLKRDPPAHSYSIPGYPEAKPEYCFVVAYKEKDVFAMPITNTRQLGSSPACSGLKSLTMHNWYQSKQRLLSANHLEVPSNPPLFFRAQEDHTFELLGCYKKKSRQLVEETTNENIEDTGVLADTAIRRLAKNCKGPLKVYLLKMDNKQVFGIVAPAIIPMTYSSAADDTTNFFKSYYDLTKLSVKLDPATVAGILANKGAEDVSQVLDKMQGPKGTDYNTLLNFANYINYKFKHPYNEDYIHRKIRFKNPDGILHTYMQARQARGSKWECSLSFEDPLRNYSQPKQRLRGSDLVSDLDIDEVEILDSGYFHKDANKLAANFILNFAKRQQSTGYWPYLQAITNSDVFLARITNTIVWAESRDEENTIGLTLINSQSPNPIKQMEARILLEDDVDLHLDEGTYLDRSPFVGEHADFFTDALPTLLTNDSSARLVIGKDKSGELLGFIYSSSSVQLVSEGGLNLKIATSRFRANLENAISAAKLNGFLMSNSRISESTLLNDPRIQARFLFSGLIDPSSWERKFRSSLHPLSLFNDSGIKRNYEKKLL